MINTRAPDGGNKIIHNCIERTVHNNNNYNCNCNYNFRFLKLILISSFIVEKLGEWGVQFKLGSQLRSCDEKIISYFHLCWPNCEWHCIGDHFELKICKHWIMISLAFLQYLIVQHFIPFGIITNITNHRHNHHCFYHYICYYNYCYYNSNPRMHVNLFYSYIYITIYT